MNFIAQIAPKKKLIKKQSNKNQMWNPQNSLHIESGFLQIKSDS